MVSFDQIQAGAIKYINHEILKGLQPGSWQKPVATAVAAFAVKGYVDKLKDNNFLKISGIITDEGVHIEKFAEELKKTIPATGLKVDIPMIGNAHFVPGDVDVLVGMMKEGRYV